MKESHQDRLPEHLLEVADRLREERVSVSPLELDELKLRAKAQAARGRRSSTLGRKGLPLRSRAVTLALTALLIGGTTAGGIAANGGGHGNSADPPYPPRMGWGGKKPNPPRPPWEPGKKPAPPRPQGRAP